MHPLAAVDAASQRRRRAAHQRPTAAGLSLTLIVSMLIDVMNSSRRIRAIIFLQSRRPRMPAKHKKKSNQPQQTPTVHVQPERPETPVEVVATHGANIIVEQNQEMARQDEQLVDLEASIGNLRTASLTINQEVSMHNRLLDGLGSGIDRVQARQEGTQERLRRFMQTSGTCKLWLTIVGLAITLVLLIVLLR